MAALAVVGAGIAGLSCALALREAGHEVEIFEAEERVGGRLRAERHGDVLVDAGAGRFGPGDERLQELARAVGQDTAWLPAGAAPGIVYADGIADGIEDLAADWSGAYLRLDEPLSGPPGGAGTLCEALADELGVRRGWAVTQVEPDPLGVRIHYVAPSGERSLRTEGAVLAVPAAVAASVCPGLTEPERAFLGGVPVARGLIVTWAFETGIENLPLRPLVFDADATAELAWLSPDHLRPGMAPKETGLVSVAFRPGRAVALWEASDAGVVGAANEALAATPIGAFEAEQTWVRHFDPIGPRFGPELEAAAEAFLGRAQRTPRLAFAGDYLAGPRAEDAAASGLAAARELLRRLSPTC